MSDSDDSIEVNEPGIREYLLSLQEVAPPTIE